MVVVPYGQVFDYRQKFTIIFNHIYKCGGSTFKGILHKYLMNKNLIIYNCVHFIHFLSLIKELKKEFEIYNNLFMGHFSWGLHEYLNYSNDRKIFYITILRDPWNIFLSQYKFRFIKGFFSYDITTFFDKEYEHNFLTNWLGNGDLELAKYNLEKKHYLFGIVEQYDDFLKMFAHFFKLRSINYYVYNKSVIKDGFKEDRKEIIKLKYQFLKKNKLDYELYKFAKELFNKRFNILNTDSIEIKKYPKPVMNQREEDIAKIFLNNNLDLKQKENLLKKNIVNNPVFDFNINFLIGFYEKNKMWNQLLSLCKTIIYLINNYFSKNLLKDNDSCLRKYINRLLKVYSKYSLYNTSSLEEDIKEYINFIFNITRNNFISFCKNTDYQKIAFYGISGRFFSYLSFIEKYLLNNENTKEIFLLDSDINKQGNKIESLTILSPDKLNHINPDVVIITSAFWKEINDLLLKFKNDYNLNFKILYLDNFHLYNLTN